MSAPREQLREWQGWGGVLLGPLAWALHLNVSFAIAHWFCDASSLVLHGITAVAALLAATGTALSWQGRRHFSADEPEDAPRAFARARFVATLGVLIGVLSLAGIIVEGLPAFFMEPCR